MAFANVAGRAGFVLDLDKSQLDRGLVEAERLFDRSTRSMEQSAQRVGSSNVTVAGTFEPLLNRTRQLQREADVLAERAAGMGRGLGTASTGAAALAGGMGSLVARAGLVGGAISAAIQGADALSKALDVSGAAAFTAEGRLRNVGAALIDFDPGGAIKALTQGVQTFDDLGIAAKDAAAHLDELQIAADAMGGKWRRIYDEARLVAEAYRDQAAAAREVLNASLGLRDALGNFAIPQGFASLRPQPAPLPPFGTPTPGPSPAQDEEARRRQAERDDDLAAQKRIADEQVRRARYRLGLVKQPGKLYDTRFGELQDALDRQDSINDRVAAENSRKADEAAATREKQAADAKAARERAAADAQARRDEAERAYRERISTREQTLENEYRRALGTPGRRDDRQRASALSAFLGARSGDTRLEEGEREEFRSRQLAFLADRRKDREAVAKAAIDATRDELRLQEEVLQNNVKAAELTEKNKRDDIDAVRRLRDFYRREERDSDLTRAERQAFRGDRLDTQKRLNELLRADTKAATEDIGNVLREFMEGMHDWQTRLISTFVGGTGAGNALQTHALEQFTLAGNTKLDEQTSLLRRIAGGRQQRLADEGLMA